MSIWCQIAFLKFPSLHAAKRVIAKICPVKFFNRVAKRGEGAADLAVTAFAHLDDPAVVVAVVLALKRQAAGSVRQLHAKVVNHLPVERLQRLVERHQIALNFIKRRVCHLVSEVAVVGEENESGAIFVQAADGLEVMETGWQ